MDFDYEKIKDNEGKKYNMQFLPVPRERRNPNLLCTSSPPPIRAPPVRPRTELSQHQLPGSGLELQSSNRKDVDKQTSTSVPPNCFRNLKPQPPSMHHLTLQWFQLTQAPLIRERDGKLPVWFYGFTTRREAEDLLQDQPIGCFLLRFSESKIGFVLSYKGNDRCRHFIIDHLKEGGYLIIGEQSTHPSLESLIRHYQNNPVGPFSEYLTTAFTKVRRLSEGDCRTQNGTQQAESGDMLLTESQESTSESSSFSSTPTAAGNQKQGDPEYAVVKKVLRKTKSLNLPDIRIQAPAVDMDSFINSHEDSQSREVELPGFIPLPPNQPLLSNGLADSALTPATLNPPSATTNASDVSSGYARVNKKRPAAAQAEPSSSVEEKYSELMALHTYEDPFLLTGRHDIPRQIYSEPDDPIEFYAVGRNLRPDTSVALQNHNIYSEVHRMQIGNPPVDPLQNDIIGDVQHTSRVENLSSSSSSSTLLSAPNPSVRPQESSSAHGLMPQLPPRGIQTEMNLHFRPLLPHPWRTEARPQQTEDSIYEQIRDRPPRPPLPPLNKRP
ncbi:uncharacterized protein si:ch73-109i22.2 isoform X2 [Erpetoichthys calabaricus]|uniref:uncharacterized protein si:ch73-109i22.2 isoform X2 n=1 Tax=Erpetoichthys calabaricus TaxID=27687 RepID=UPI0010A09A23|nr:uncharacterized protein si:ch73-109i22.2 isoform X2 [Erpetoichthys calabaricus]